MSIRLISLRETLKDHAAIFSVKGMPSDLAVKTSDQIDVKDRHS